MNHPTAKTSLLALILLIPISPLPAQENEEPTPEPTPSPTPAESPADPSTLSFPTYGFQIDALEGEVGETPATVLALYLPPRDGFAPNINVQIQPFKGTLDDYVKLTKGQFEHLDWELVSDDQPEDYLWIFEYKGPIQGTQLHWYATATLHQDKVYLVTATAPQSAWEEVSPTLKKHVDSFRLIQKAAPPTDQPDSDTDADSAADPEQETE